MNVIEVDNKKEFEKELNKTLSTSLNTDAIGEITVVNIQKFGSEMPEARNDYDANVQRIFIIDEAHRSYKNTGEFFKNLMLVDDNSVLIALTGTPLLSKKRAF
ncbi:DEAD/DEAH box helicase family protein [Peribacillus frigoritolerans]|nr:DEAD/DEAH box helicase family protein [Peribacillus frigoritolerans]